MRKAGHVVIKSQSTRPLRWLDIDCSIILKCILKEKNVRMWAGFIWLRIRSSGEFFWTQWPFGVHKRQVISWLTERLLATQEEHCSMEFAINELCDCIRLIHFLVYSLRGSDHGGHVWVYSWRSGWATKESTFCLYFVTMCIISRRVPNVVGFNIICLSCTSEPF